jgi:hypothetical protein
MTKKGLIGPRGPRGRGGDIGPKGEKGDTGLTCKEITVPCDHRFTLLEEGLKAIKDNELKHINNDLKLIKRILYFILTSVVAGFIGLLFFIIKGHIIF